MGIADYVLIICLCMIVLSILLTLIYCCVQEKIDRYKANNSDQLKSENIIQEQQSHVSVEKRIYRYIQSYARGFVRYQLILTGKIPSNRIRKVLYKYIFRMKISKNTIIGGGCEIRSPWNIKIGNSTLACGCVLDGRSGIEIGDNVVFGSFVHVWTEEHDFNDPYFRVLSKNKQPVIIDDRAWVCSDVTLLPGVHIHEGAVVAARGCVTKDCDAYTVYGGVPAKKIADRNKNLVYNITGKPFYRFY